MKGLNFDRASNKRLERTSCERASLVSNLGEPLKRNVRSLLVIPMISSFKLLVLAFCILASGSALAFAQGASDEPEIVPSDSSGEITSREIDRLSIEVKGNRQRLFVIARLGAGETSARLNRGRLYNTKQYLSTKAFDPQTTVFAEGERVEGEGRIEFYLGGSLRLVTLAKRNKIPHLTCCEDYFPSGRSRKNRSGNR